MPTYLDENGEPITQASPAPRAAPVYLDDQGNPIGQSGSGYLAGAETIGETPWYDRGIGGLVGMTGRGPSVRDALNALPAVGGAVGGVVGGAGGTVGGMAVGGAPGAVGGAALGGAAGEAARQQIGDLIGIPKPQTAGARATDIAKEAAVQGAAEVVGQAVPVVAGKAVKTFLTEPEKQYAQALGATTVANKQLSEKIVPELIERRVSGSREAIKELAEKQIGKSGAELEEALAKIPKGTAADTSAVVNQLQSLKKQYVVPSGTPGVNTIVNKQAYENLGKLQQVVASTQPTYESVRRLRQILDGMVTAGDKTFGRTIAEGSELDATREAANAIRKELAKASPNVARINKEYTFWKNVDRVTGDTLRRTASQSKGIGQEMAESVAAPVGTSLVVAGHGAPAAAAAMPVLLRKLVQSPGWKTFSAVQKDRLADAIARGDAQKVTALLAHATTGAARIAQDDQP